MYVKKYDNSILPLAKHISKVTNNVSLFFRHGDSQVWWIVFGVICLLTAATRFYKVGEPEHVV